MDSKALSEVSACEDVPVICSDYGDTSQAIKKLGEASKALGFYAVFNSGVLPEEVEEELKSMFFRLPVEKNLDSDDPSNAVTRSTSFNAIPKLVTEGLMISPAFKTSREGEHSYNKGSSEASDERGASRFFAPDYKSRLVGTDIERIRGTFGIPNDYILRVPDFEDNVCSVNKGDMVLYEADLRAGLRLPFHSFIRRLLLRLGLAPGQLAPNAWRIVVFCLKLWQSYSEGSAELSVDEFLYCYKLIPVPKSSDHWYFVARDNDTKLVTKLPSSNGSWKSNYFAVCGEALWEGVYCYRGEPNKSLFDRPNLDDFYLNRVKKAFEFSRGTDYNSLVTPRNLAPLSDDAEKSNQRRMNTKIQSQKKAKLPILKRKASSELPSQESSAHRVTPPAIGPTTSFVECNPMIVLDGPPRPSKGKEVAITPTIDTDSALETMRSNQALIEPDVTDDIPRMIRNLCYAVDEGMKKILAKLSEMDNENRH